MSVKRVKRDLSIKREVWKELHELTDLQKQTTEQTLMLLTETKQYLDFEANHGLDEKSYRERLKILINMGIIYYYALYEGFTRFVFKKMRAYELDISEDRVNDRDFTLHKIITYMKSRYKIYLEEEMFSVIIKLKEARHDIAHGVGDAKPDFDIILICHSQIVEYFDFILHEMAKILNFI